MKRMLSIFQTKLDVRIFKVALMLFCVLSFSTGKASEPQSAVKYKKILVLAKIEQANLKKQFEEAVVSQLKDKGYEAVPSGSAITNEDIENMETLGKKIEELGVDAVLAFTVQNVENKVKNTPAVHASVGVPVRIGFLHAYVGSSVPLGGGPKQEKIVNVTAGFYNDKTSTEPAFTMPLSGNLAKGADALIDNFAKKSVKSLVKNDLL
jgi:hypothetical protein